LIDLQLLSPSEFSGVRTSMVASFGAVTLVLEIRDGQTREPLLRYGRRRALEGGSGMGADPAKGAPLTAAFERFAVDFRKDFARSLPRVVATAPALTCAQRAGLSPNAPQADAAREIERALSLTPDLDQGQRIYSSCAECHGPRGAGRRDGSVPQIAGQHREVIIKQLADIRAGNRDNPTMYAFAAESRLGGAQAIADVADYVASLEVSVDTEKGPGNDLELGEKLYEANCAQCHGPNGEGNGDRYIPRIQAQQYAYLTRQFQWIKDGERQNADPQMRAQIQDLSAREIAATLDYVSWLSSR
jgi:cytochrome c553